MPPRDDEGCRNGKEHSGERRAREGQESFRDLGRKSPEELEEEIDQIRAEMDRTLSAIEKRFDLPGFWEQTIENLSAREGGFAANLGSVLRKNPVPAVLAGIGLTWLALASAGETDGHRRHRVEKSGLFQRWQEAAFALKELRKRRRVPKGPVRPASRRRRRRSGSFPPWVDSARGTRRPLFIGSLGAALGAALAAALPVHR